MGFLCTSQAICLIWPYKEVPFDIIKSQECLLAYTLTFGDMSSLHHGDYITVKDVRRSIIGAL